MTQVPSAFLSLTRYVLKGFAKDGRDLTDKETQKFLKAADKDGDGKLTPDERQRLIGFDTNWDEGFNGDLEIRAAGQLLALSGPMQATTDLREGRIVSTHVRKI